MKNFMGYMIHVIIVLFMGAIMFFSCKTNPKEITALTKEENSPEMSGENMELIYSVSYKHIKKK